LWAEFVVKAARRSIRRQRYFVGQKFNVLETAQPAYAVTLQRDVMETH